MRGRGGANKGTVRRGGGQTNLLPDLCSSEMICVDVRFYDPINLIAPMTDG